MVLWHLQFMAAMYIGIGCMHFIKPKAFLRVIPRYIPKGKLMVYLSGIVEIGLGIALFFEQTRILALWGIIAMLIVFLMVHWYMIRDKKFHTTFPLALLWFRFILQFGLMYWAYYYIQ